MHWQACFEDKNCYLKAFVKYLIISSFNHLIILSSHYLISLSLYFISLSHLTISLSHYLISLSLFFISLSHLTISLSHLIISSHYLISLSHLIISSQNAKQDQRSNKGQESNVKGQWPYKKRKHFMKNFNLWSFSQIISPLPKKRLFLRLKIVS